MVVTAALSPEEVERRLGTWRDEEGALYRSLADAFGRVIEQGVIAPGTRLPAERRLAARLHVARGTVVSAYDELRGRGLLETRQGSGTVVRPGASAVSGPREAYVASSLTSDRLFRGAMTPDDEPIDLYGAYWFGTEALDEGVVARAAASIAQA